MSSKEKILKSFSLEQIDFILELNQDDVQSTFKDLRRKKENNERQRRNRKRRSEVFEDEPPRKRRVSFIQYSPKQKALILELFYNEDTTFPNLQILYPGLVRDNISRWKRNAEKNVGVFK